MKNLYWIYQPFFKEYMAIRIRHLKAYEKAQTKEIRKKLKTKIIFYLLKEIEHI